MLQPTMWESLCSCSQTPPSGLFCTPQAVLVAMDMSCLAQDLALEKQGKTLCQTAAGHTTALSLCIDVQLLRHFLHLV